MVACCFIHLVNVVAALVGQNGIHLLPAVLWSLKIFQTDYLLVQIPSNSSLFCCQTELHFISAFSEVILPWACLQPARKLPQNVASGIVMHFRKSIANSHVLCGLQIFNSKSSHLQFRVAGLIYFGESRLSFLLNFG